MSKQTSPSLKRAKETCIMCGADLSGFGVIRRFSGALMFGNKSRDPHVGPYCPNCGPPAIAKLVECVEDCPLTDAKWIPVDGNCITKTRKWRGDDPKCEFSLGNSPIRHGISCIHPDRLKKKREEKARRAQVEK